MSIVSPLTATAPNATSGASDFLGAVKAPATAGAPNSFGDMLNGAISGVNALQNAAAQQATSFALGKATDIHDVMIAAQKATVALNLTAAVRNKVVEAYQSVMAMQM